MSTFGMPKLENLFPLRKIMFPAPAPSYTETHEALFYIDRTTYRETAAGANAVPAMSALSPRAKLTILYSHGNGCDLAECYGNVTEYSRKLNANVYAYEYPGYGVTQNTNEVATAEGLRQNCLAVCMYILNSGVLPENLILLGRSIGSGPTVFAAKEIQSMAAARGRNIGAVVLISPFTSIRNVAYDMTSLLGLFCPTVFQNESILSDMSMCTVPLLLMHGTEDTVILPENSQTLYKNASTTKKRIVEIKYTGHNFYETSDMLMAEVLAFLRSRGPAAHKTLI